MLTLLSVDHYWSVLVDGRASDWPISFVPTVFERVV